MKTDAQLQQDVMEELEWEPSLVAPQIGVAAHQGVITLIGTVNSFAQKLTAEKAAKRVEGVRAVALEITVKGSIHAHTDEEIAQAILNTFKWHSEIPHERIKAKVQQGWITLEGDVDWNYQKLAAEQAIQYLLGVNGITNLINVRTNLAIWDIKNKIISAFKRNAVIDANNIKVEAVGNKVILKGKVHSWIERHQAEASAWSAPGVLSVEDDLIVAN